MDQTPQISGSGLSVTGIVRENNQDSIHLSQGSPEQGLLFAVADGMGGFSGGEIASSLALEVLQNAHSRLSQPDPSFLKRAVERANLAVYQKSQQLGQGLMGTTLTAAYLLGNTLWLAHVGDSRAYLLRGDKTTLLTEDHTLVGDLVRAHIIPPERVRTHAQRSKLTRAIGMGLFVTPDITQHNVQTGDRLLLCSDGLWGSLPDEDIARLASDLSSPAEQAQRLVDAAIQNESDDNVSVIVTHLNRLAQGSTQSIPDTFAWLNLFRKFSR